MVRSQAALEFLVTYAWAFIGIIIALGALYYFGAFDLSRFLEQKCIFPQQFECVAFSFVGDEVRLRLVNNAGETIDVKGYSISNDLPVPLSCADPATFNGWLAGEERDFTFTGCFDGGYIQNERTEAKISITYCAPATTLCPAHTINGKITAVVS